MATLFKRSNGIFYVVDFLDGRRTWKSTGTKTYREAKQFLRRHSALPKAPPPPPPSKTTSEKFGKTFLEYAEANLAPTTVMLYRAAIKTFIRLISN